MIGHQFVPHADYPNICGVMMPTTAKWPAPPTRACGGKPEDHGTVAATFPGTYKENPAQKENITMTLPQHSRFGTWTPAVAADGDDYKAREHYGNHAIVKVREYKPEIVTPNSPNGAPGVIVDVYDLNKKEVYRDVLMMTGAIVDTFKPHVDGPPIVVQWEKKVGASGRPYPAPAPAVPAAIEAAEAVYANGDPFAEKLGTIEEEAPF